MGRRCKALNPLQTLPRLPTTTIDVVKGKEGGNQPLGVLCHVLGRSVKINNVKYCGDSVRHWD